MPDFWVRYLLEFSKNILDFWPFSLVHILKLANICGHSLEMRWHFKRDWCGIYSKWTQNVNETSSRYGEWHESLERRLTKFKFLWHTSQIGVDPSALNPHFLTVQEMGFVWNLAGCWYKLRSTADKSFELETGCQTGRVWQDKVYTWVKKYESV